jgi:hypothetical protein
VRLGDYPLGITGKERKHVFQEMKLLYSVKEGTLQLHYKSLPDALQAKDMSKQLPLIFGKLLLVSRAG